VVREPKIFLFDEPLSNLDAELRVQMRGEIKALHRRLGNTMIYVTHDQVEAMTMADRICVLRAGRVEQVGRPLDLYNRPANRFVAGFIGSPRMNFLEGEIVGGDSAGVEIAIDGLPPLRLPLDANGGRQKVSIGVRPEHVRRVDAAQPGFTARIVAAEHLGSDSYLMCMLPGGQPLNIHRPGQELTQHDETLRLALDPDLCHAFAQEGAQAALPRRG
jgi:multiple sugar transport system ATP-binding protein